MQRGRLRIRIRKLVGQTWQEDAECNKHPQDDFYDEEDRLAEEKAKLICSICPVQQECLEYALTSNEEYGIWGGTTAAERRTLLRRLQHEKASSSP